jgi:hypothetical protein
MVETIAIIHSIINLFAAYLAEIVWLFSAGDGGLVKSERWEGGNQGSGKSRGRLL